MATTENNFTGDGSLTRYSFTFEYIDEGDIKVSLDGTNTTDWSLANATTVLFDTAPANDVHIRIFRDTNIDSLNTTFFAGSSIRAQDLNSNFLQNNYAVQELENNTWDKETATIHSDETWVSSDTQIATTAAMDARFQDEANETIESTETWISDDDHIPTTLASDNRVDDKIDTAITNDIGTDGTGITVTDDGDGTITLGIGAGTVDLDRIKAEDIETSADYDAAWDNDNQIATVDAIATRLDALVQTATPSGTDWKVGKIWLQNDDDRTLSMWNGSTWLGIASGGTFTTQPTVIYVDSVNGNDTNDGHRIIQPMRTIRAAVASADAGDIIMVAPGVYQETLPIDIEVNNLSIVGSSQRSCFIHPTVATEENTMFRVNSGTYIDGFTFCGLKASGTRGGHAVDNDTVEGLPTNQAWVAEFFPNATIRKSPYINNCTNYADSGIDNAAFDPNNYAGTGGDTSSNPTGGGVFVDGDAVAQASPLRSMVINEFTQVCLDGPGLLVANNGYCQAVSFFSTFCHYHAKALNGGQINMEVGTTDFGRFGLIADGKSSTAIFTSTVNANAVIGDTIISIDAPTAAADWFGTAERPGNTMLCQVGTDIYPILSSTADGTGWDVTISNPRAANREINDGLVADIANGAAISFFLRSQISSAAHTFEYAGSGTDYTALPYNGGAPNEANEVIETGPAAIVGNQTEGRVWYSSTDQNGNFKVGDTFQVNQQTGFVTIDPTSIAVNVVADLTPQLGGNLDVQTFEINTSTSNGDVTVSSNGNGNINLTAPGTGLLRVTEANLTQVPVVTQHDIGTAANEVPLNQMLGSMAFQDAASISVDALTVDTDTLVVDASTDRVGIGTTTPDRVLEIRDSAPIIRLTDDDNNYSEISGNTSVLSLRADEANGAAADTRIDFRVDGSEKLRITHDNFVRLASGTSGIQFNGDTAAANALDDYEEGTWTPIISSGTNVFTYTTQLGYYVKIGKFVQASCEVVAELTTINSLNAQATIQLPFRVKANDRGVTNIAWTNGGSDTTGTGIYTRTHKATSITTSYSLVRVGRGSTTTWPASTNVTLAFNLSYTTAD